MREPDVREQYSFPDGGRGRTGRIKSRKRAAEFVLDREICTAVVFTLDGDLTENARAAFAGGGVVHYLAKPMIFRRVEK